MLQIHHTDVLNGDLESLILTVSLNKLKSEPTYSISYIMGRDVQ